MIVFIMLLFLFLCLPSAAHAKGGKTRTVDALGPKSQNLIDLENRFYGMANQIMDGYTGTYTPPTAPASGGAPQPAAGKGGARGGAGAQTWVPTRDPSDRKKFVVPVPLSLNPSGRLRDWSGFPTSVSQAQPASQAAAAGKGGARGGIPAASPQATASAGKGGARGGANGGNYWSNDNLMGRLLNDATKKTFASNRRYDELMRRAPELSRGSIDALSSANDALRQSWTAGDPYFSQANQNYADAKRLLGVGESYLRQAPTAGDEWYGKAKDVYGRAEDMLGDIQSNLRYARETDKWYSDYAKNQLAGAETLMNTGRIPQPILDALNASVRSGLDKSMGAGLSDLAARGVLNSSVANRGLSDMSREAADSLNRGYLDAFRTVLGGYQGNANTAATAGKAFTDALMEINNSANTTLGHTISLGDSYGRTGAQKVADLLSVAAGYANNAQTTGNLANSLMDAGSKRIQDYLGIAQGYGNLSSGYLNNLNTNLAEREQLNKAIAGYYTNAMAPMLPAYDLLKTMQQDHWNSDKRDTIIKQGK